MNGTFKGRALDQDTYSTFSATTRSHEELATTFGASVARIGVNAIFPLAQASMILGSRKIAATACVRSTKSYCNPKATPKDYRFISVLLGRSYNSILCEKGSESFINGRRALLYCRGSISNGNRCPPPIACPWLARPIRAATRQQAARE